MEPLINALSNFSLGFSFTDITNTAHFLQYVIGYVDDNSILCTLPDSTPYRVILQTATNVLQSWQLLLRHTGGDLSLPKCVFTMITWLPNNQGELRMTIIKDTHGELTIKDTPSTLSLIHI